MSPFTWFAAWRERRRERTRVRRRAESAAWRAEVLRTLLLQVLAPDTPYVYEGAFSWLGERTEPAAIPRLTLFLPELPLAIDLLGPEAAEHYEEAAAYLARPAWERFQAELAERRRRLQLHRCPYLVIRHSEPVDVQSLRERVRTLLGRRTR